MCGISECWQSLCQPLGKFWPNRSLEEVPHDDSAFATLGSEQSSGDDIALLTRMGMGAPQVPLPLTP